MAGLVLEKTPETVPFQDGVAYPQIFTNLIPRVIWPDKPTVNDSNRFFQIEYGLTTQNDIQGVSIACGFEAEGYMNFGWFGVAGISLFVGLILGVYELAFFSKDVSLATTALGLALLPGFWTIESQLVVYLGGVVQVVFATCFVFWSPNRRALTSKPNSSVDATYAPSGH